MRPGTDAAGPAAPRPAAPPPDVVVVVPARMASARLPGKPLADLCGRPMVVRVAERARLAASARRVLVATEDEEIVRAVEAAGFEAVRTSRRPRCGTERVAEAADLLGLPDDALVVDVQGDEPLLDPASVDAVAAALREDEVATGAAPFPRDADPADPHRVKVVVDRTGRALYFSRAPVPARGPWLLHVGIYGFRAAALRRYRGWSPGPLERAERLEQLRFLEHGTPVRVARLDSAAPSVDSPGDLERVRRLLGCAG